MEILLNALARRAAWKRIGIHFAVCALIIIGISTHFFGLLKMDYQYGLDNKRIYSPAFFYEALDGLGAAGRGSYLVLHLFDYIYIPFWALFWSFLLIRLARGFRRPGWLMALSLLPLAYGVLDVAENIGIDLALFAYPRRLLPIAAVSGYITFGKTILLTLAEILAAALAAGRGWIFVGERLRRRTGSAV